MKEQLYQNLSIIWYTQNYYFCNQILKNGDS